MWYNPATCPITTVDKGKLKTLKPNQMKISEIRQALLDGTLDREDGSKDHTTIKRLYEGLSSGAKTLLKAYEVKFTLNVDVTKSYDTLFDEFIEGQNKELAAILDTELSREGQLLREHEGLPAWTLDTEI